MTLNACRKVLNSASSSPYPTFGRRAGNRGPRIIASGILTRHDRCVKPQKKSSNYNMRELGNSSKRIIQVTLQASGRQGIIRDLGARVLAFRTLRVGLGKVSRIQDHCVLLAT